MSHAPPNLPLPAFFCMEVKHSRRMAVLGREDIICASTVLRSATSSVSASKGRPKPPAAALRAVVTASTPSRPASSITGPLPSRGVSPAPPPAPSFRAASIPASVRPMPPDRVLISTRSIPMKDSAILRASGFSHPMEAPTSYMDICVDALPFRPSYNVSRNCFWSSSIS